MSTFGSAVRLSRNFLGRRERIEYKWLVSISVMCGTVMTLLDYTIVNVAIPHLRQLFHADLQSAQWIVTIFMITQAVVIPSAPYLISRFGSKRSWVWTLAAFLGGSILCGFAWNLPSLVLFRMIQGLGGGVLLPMAMSLTYQTFRTNERARATSLMAIPMMVAPVLGPVLGGYLVERWGWQWIFLINIPIGIIGIVIAQKVLRESEIVTNARFDSLGFITIAAGSGLLLFAVSTIHNGELLGPNIVLLSLGIGLLLLFAYLETHQRHKGDEPLLDLTLFRDRTFTFSGIAWILQSMLNFGVLFLIPQYLQTVRHFSAIRSGTIISAFAIATLAALPFTGKLSQRFGPRAVAIAGLTIVACTDFALTRIATTTPLVLVIVSLIFLGISGALSGQIQVSAMSNIEKDKRKEVTHGSTLIVVLRCTGAPLGVALLSSVTQGESLKIRASLFERGMHVTLLESANTLHGMHASFNVAFGLAVCATLMMILVPQSLRSTQIAESLSNVSIE